MADREIRETVPLDPRDDPFVELGQLADERQFLAALLRVDGGWMAVVHFFASEGDHLETDHSSRVPGGEEPPEEARAAFERMLRRLEPYQQDAISVSAFETELSGLRFGLSPDSATGGLRVEPNGPVLLPGTGGAAPD